MRRYRSVAPVRRQRGVTMIELMVSVTISLIILAGATVILVSANKSANLQEDLVNMQVNARFAIQQITNDLQLSGYYGCVQDPNPVDPAGPVVYNLTIGATDPATSPFITSPIRGYEHGPTPESALTADNRDVLEIQYADEVARLSGDMASLQAAIPVRAADVGNLSAGDIYLISTCEFGDIFRASAISGNTVLHQTSGTSGETLDAGVPDNAGDSLSAWYPQYSYAGGLGEEARLFRLSRIKYYVTNDHNGDGDTDDPGEDVPALMRTVNARRDAANSGAGLDEVFMRGVEAFEVLYGEDTNGDDAPDAFRDADAVANWGNITAIRFALLARSEREYGTTADQDTQESATIEVLGTDFTAGEERVRRRIYQSTVYLRNSI